MSHNPPNSPPAARPQPTRSPPAARLPPAQPDHASTPRSVRRRLLAHTKLMSGGNVVRVVLILLFWLLFAHWFAPAAPHTSQTPSNAPTPTLSLSLTLARFACGFFALGWTMCGELYWY